MSKTIKIDLVSDFACPWCFVGKRHLQSALEQRPDLNVVVNWLPFQLNPDMPREGRNRRDYYRKKFGSERAQELRKTLVKAGEAARIAFCDNPDAMAPNTLSAHVLMFWAAGEDNIDTHALAEKIFIAHHVGCENIGDHEVLARIAGDVGMDSASVVARLSAGDDEEHVSEQVRQSSASGVSGVPFFIIDRSYGISGAQPPKTLTSILDQASNNNALHSQ